MYKITYILIGIVVIFSFYLQIHGDDFKDVQMSKFKRQIPKNIADKCKLGEMCKNIENDFNSNPNNNFAKYYNQIPINLVPPLATSKDYYTYFNRRKKGLKYKNTVQDVNQSNVQDYNIKNEKASSKNHTIEEDVRPSYVRDHAPVYVAEENSQNQTKYKDNREETSLTNLSQISPDGDRVEFQIQGHEGPKTYIFGFDTGSGKNRQYRLEERLIDGTVKGHYGYYDARGKLRTVKYISKPIEGYQEKHHEAIAHGDKN